MFWGERASKIQHVAYLFEPVEPGHTAGDWWLVEARGVMAGVVKTRLSQRRPNYWGLMTKYFDYSASDPSVSRAAARAVSTCANPGRSGHRPALRAAEIVYDCREEAAAFFGIERPERVVFTQNATHSLNLAIKSLLHGGGHAVISGYEHNSVVRPLEALAEQGEPDRNEVLDMISHGMGSSRQMQPWDGAIISMGRSSAAISASFFFTMA